MKLTNDGLIYVIAGDSTVWTRAPVISEIKQGSGPNGLPPVFFRVLAYRTAEPYTSSVAFTGLGSAKLKMYILPSDDNPFDTAEFDESLIKSHTISMEVAKWESYVLAAGAMLVAMMLAL